jgi:predicted metal-dependent hydrolase
VKAAAKAAWEAAVTIGETVIRYAVRVSPKARALRLVVTPDGVEVVAPEAEATPEAVEAFLRTRRRWLFDAVREVAARQSALLAQRYESGARLQYRGRWLMLDVTAGDVEAVGIACRSKLHVTVPRAVVGSARREAVEAAFAAWLRARAADDLGQLGKRLAARLGVSPAGYRLSEARRRWGSCGRDGVIHVHWQLSQAPLCAFEYVVAHELAHLVHRNHGEAFWQTLATALPDWRAGKAALERWETGRRAL